ncbi:hypothetical protein FEM48_Zijuj12G0203700 [Ziziphus jujuba var. spinosa]|uniref:Pre-mRNA polyadenylation factor Fip1 domain-containing protein n=1 Tax=Ziziphus jujuba var. spinosa TaxID=714518 RepID=A0A978UFD0_ZIZJJ|nr:hypothetical protein FEM48_Zijuj12G0203700 [Ziziphus jujuba var. spinosa]
MEDFDDDFGELYADVEAQSSSVMNWVPEFHRLYTGPEVEDNSDSTGNAMNAGPSSKEGFASALNNNPSSIGNDSTLKSATCLERNEENYGSDSEDDLNILLNDEDCESKNFLVSDRGSMKNDKDNEDDDDDGGGGIVAGKEFKCVRTHGSSFPSNVTSSVSVRDKWDYNVCGVPKGSNSCQIALNRASFPSSMLTQSGYGPYGFSLPWYRFIFDVNIDTFEEKPWRYPGVDVTDFFNFGFNEDSWKQYCDSLEQFQRHTFMQSGVSVYESSKLYQVHEAGTGYDKLVQETGDEMPQVESGNLASPSRFVDYGESHLELPKGRVIQVEDGITERQPSADIRRRPRNRDSGVVIQITVQDFSEEVSDSPERLGHAHSTIPQASENEKFVAKDNKDASHPESCKGDEHSVESLEGNVGFERCSQKATAFKPMTSYPDNHGNGQSPDVDVHHLKKINSFSSEGTVGLLETVKNTNDSVCKTTVADPCIIETELLLGDEVELSPTSSCFASDTETSKDSILFFHEEAARPVRRSSMDPGTKLRESISSYHKNSKANGAKRKSVEIRDCSRYKFPNKDKQKHHTRKHETPLQPKKKTIYDNDASPISDGEQLYDRDCLLLNHSRQKEKLQDLEFSDKILAYRQESKHSRYYDGRRYAESHICNVGRNYPCSKGSRNFHEESDPYVRKKSKERGYLFEGGKRERYHCGRRNLTMDRSPLTYKESGNLVPRISSITFENMDSQFKRQSERLQFRKLYNHNNQFLGHGCDDFEQNRYVRSVPLTDLERDILHENSKRMLPHIRRESKDSHRSRYDDPPSLELDSSWSEETEDEYYRNLDNMYLSHQSEREFFKADRVSWNDSISQRLDAFDSRLTGRYQRHGRQLLSREERQNNWFDNYDDADEIEDGTFYPNEQDNLGQGRCNRQPDVLHWAENDLTMRHRDEKMNPEKSSFFCNGSVGRGRSPATYGSPHDDMQAKQHVFKKMRNGSNTLFTNRSSKMYTSKHEQTVLRSRNSIDLIVDEGKSSRRCPRARNLKYDGRSENGDPEIAEEQLIKSVYFNEFPRKKEILHELQKDGHHYNNEKSHKKFPVLRNEDFDIEEGQIVTEETYITGIIGRSHATECQVVNCNMKRQLQCRETTSNPGKIVGANDDQRIVEMLAKMEKRRERFKEPITVNKEEENCLKAEVLIVDTVENKQHRPARKRRWGGG